MIIFTRIIEVVVLIGATIEIIKGIKEMIDYE